MEFFRGFFFVSIVIIFILSTASANAPVMSAFSKNKNTTHMKLSVSEEGDFVTHYFQQTIDHFTYKKDSFKKFPQKYILNSKYWGGPVSKAPILVYLEGEAPLQVYPNLTSLTAEAPGMKALLVFIEHRFYGDSYPFVDKPYTLEKLPHNAEQLGYLNSEQALADVAELISSLKTNLSAKGCPVIVHGGSYAGMLSFWLRLKYPHIVWGAYASSAPVLYFLESTKENLYPSVVSRDFEEVSRPCFDTVRSSWGLIDEFASKPDGLAILTQKFKSCSPLKTTKDLKAFFIYVYSGAAQYGTVEKVCVAINTAPPGSDIFSRILAGAIASGFDIEFRKGNCYEFRPNATAMRRSGWYWQTCTEFIQPQVKKEDTMFRYLDLVIANKDQCHRLFGVPKRPNWLQVEYGGEDLKSVLKQATSNILFTNGLKDPYSVGGILQNISDTIIALPTLNGTHCTDLNIPVLPFESDPYWKREQREAAMSIIKGWIAKYYATR